MVMAYSSSLLRNRSLALPSRIADRELPARENNGLFLTLVDNS